MAEKKGMEPKRKRHEIRREQVRKRALKRKLSYAAMLAVITVVVVAAVVLHNTLSKEDSDTEIHDGNSQNGTPVIGTEVGQIAPDFYLMDTGGHNFALWDQRDSVVVLDFMTTWCGPCEQEMEHLKEVRSNYDNDVVKLISIDVDDRENSTKLEEFKYNHSCDWIFAAGGGGVGEIYDIVNIPTIFVINKQGKITYRNIGLTEYQIVQSEINRLL